MVKKCATSICKLFLIKNASKNKYYSFWTHPRPKIKPWSTYIYSTGVKKKKSYVWPLGRSEREENADLHFFHIKLQYFRGFLSFKYVCLQFRVCIFRDILYRRKFWLLNPSLNVFSMNYLESGCVYPTPVLLNSSGCINSMKRSAIALF